MVYCFEVASCQRTLPEEFFREYTVFIVQAYQTSQYVVPRGGIFLGKWRSSFAGSFDGKMKTHCNRNRFADFAGIVGAL
jgi:hypothetical protein